MQRHRSLLHLQFAGGFVPGLFADEAFAAKFLRTAMTALGQGQAGLRLLKLCLDHTVVEAKESVALLDLAAFGKVDFNNASRNFGTQHDGVF